METTIYTVEYFIKKFESIPENEIGQLTSSRHCTLWHCAGGDAFKAYSSAESRALGILFGANDDSDYPYDLVYTINDGKDQRYQQPTPKQRILAALYDIKAKQQPEVKERIVYVTVDQKVRELQKAETLTN